MVLRLVLVSLGIVVAAAWIVRRLLGIDRGRWAATLVSVVVGEGATIGILQAVTGHATSLSWRWVPVGLAMVTCLSMLTFALLELLVGSLRSRQGARVLLHPLASLRRLAARTTRYLQVSMIAFRNGLLRGGGDELQPPGSRLGRSLTATFEDAGGLFVKLGQAMAAQPHLTTPAVAAELSRLHDQVVPADLAAIRAVIQDELGPPEDVFADFVPDPAGAASIAQTHFATLHDGRAVVVKVQRPGMRESVERDLDILERLVDRLDRRAAWARSLGLKELAAGFAESTREELDFRYEAANVAAARQAVQGVELISVPQVMDEFTTGRVLVEERVQGRSLATPGVLDRLDGDRRRPLADALLGLMIRQMAAGERFHADPHPGNVFLTPDGRLALIDFGAVGRLNRFERAGLIDLLRGMQTEDPSLLRQGALRIGTLSARLDTDALDRELAGLLSRATRPDGTLNPALFTDFLTVFRDFGIALPRSTTTLFRTLVTLVGTIELIDPRYNLIQGIQRLGGEVVAQQMFSGGIREFLQQEALSAAPLLKRLPQDIDDLARGLVRGEIRTRTSLLSEPEDVRVATGLLNRLVLGMIGTGLALASALLLTVQSAPGHDIGLVDVIGGIGLSFSALLLLRVIVQIFREQN
ncbi:MULTISPECIES: AarF/ABC1/UbiB kinase family protein [Streptacidiphilus]|uniref:ABC1 kinase family protein n=2 Tax=Streptacidiphilus TaxID=228398 RepID=A0ABV6UUZ8_9ACTN|nr:AarF/UbiB family protein [Streptacidiphilus jeojiense]